MWGVRYNSATADEKRCLKKLEGKIAVVSGGTEGIGLTTANLFVPLGTRRINVVYRKVSESHGEK